MKDFFFGQRVEIYLIFSWTLLFFNLSTSTSCL